MSGRLALAVSAAETVAILATTILIRQTRSIQSSSGIIIPDVVIEEVSRDELQITEHPIEQGSKISDHAYKKPREVTLRWAWSNSSHFSETFVKDVFHTLRSLQNSREPFTLFTGKSAYSNMLIASLGQTTDAASEYSLNVVAVCREVIIVGTQTVSSPDQTAQSIPQSTSPVIDKGQAGLIQPPDGFQPSSVIGAGF